MMKILSKRYIEKILVLILMICISLDCSFITFFIIHMTLLMVFVFNKIIENDNINVKKLILQTIIIMYFFIFKSITMMIFISPIIA